MTKEELSTKEKILAVAHTLFAEKGVDGVGVREIAKQADVNVAAINYHFGNKDALYSATISDCMRKMNSEIDSLFTEGMEVTDLISAHYDLLLENKEDLITSFKLFLNNHSKLLDVHEDDKVIGPPGGSVVFRCLKAKHPKVEDSDLFWAVRTILTQTIHTALIVCKHADSICENTGMSEKDMKDSVLRTVKVVVKSLK